MIWLLLIPATWLAISGLALLVMLGAHALRHRGRKRHLRQRLRPF